MSTADERASALAAAQDRLERADAAVAEHRRIQARIEQAEVRLADAVRATDQAEVRLVSETDDVKALEGYSPTRIWAGLRGRRDADFEREEAERQQADYFAAVARAEVQRVQAEIEGARASQHRLGDVTAARDAALVAKELLVTSDGGAAGVLLATISERAGLLRAEGAQLEQAEAAAGEAQIELEGALAMLGKAGDWAAWDTFGGGGGFTDAMKYSRMDEATQRLHRCQLCLRSLADELADVEMPAVAGVSVTTSQQLFDVFFDNIFSDWSVRNRIRDADASARAAYDQVRDVRRQLLARRTAVEAQLSDLVAHREDLLTEWR